MSLTDDEPFGNILAVVEAEMAALERDRFFRTVVHGVRLPDEPVTIREWHDPVETADRIRMHSSDRGDATRPPRIDTRWHPDGCTCHACRKPRASVVTSTRDAFRPTGQPPPFRWAGRT